jgi:hypothetical protein
MAPPLLFFPPTRNDTLTAAHTQRPGKPRDPMSLSIATQPNAPTALLLRVRAEYSELPGLRLTLPQACLLFGANAGECQGVLQHLVDAQFLKTMTDGSYIRLA